MGAKNPPLPPKPPKPPSVYPSLDANAAVKRAQKWVGTNRRSEMCAQFSQEGLLNGKSGNYDDAREWYNDAAKRNWVKTGAPPAGVPVFYAGNAEKKHGHVAISAGGGYVYSTDAQGNKVGKVKYNELWGGTGSGQYLGWSSMVRTDRKNHYAKVNFDPKTVGNAPKVIVTGLPKDITKTSGSDSAVIKSTVDKAPASFTEAFTASGPDGSSSQPLAMSNPRLSKQFAGIKTSGNIPRVG
jgi:hypothetical protein